MGRDVRLRRMGQRVSTVRARSGGRSGATGTTTIGVTCGGGHIGVPCEHWVRGCTRPEVGLGLREEVVPSVRRRVVSAAGGRHWALRHCPVRTCLGRGRRCCLPLVLLLVLVLGLVLVLVLGLVMMLVLLLVLVLVLV